MSWRSNFNQAIMAIAVLLSIPAMAQQYAPDKFFARQFAANSSKYFMLSDLTYNRKDTSPVNGTLYTFYEDSGNVFSAISYKKGKAVSETVFSSTGERIQHVRYWYDPQGKQLRTGRMKKWHKNGRIAKTEHYRHGFKQGRCREYDENGRWTRKQYILILKKKRTNMGMDWKGIVRTRTMERYSDGQRKSLSRYRIQLVENWNKSQKLCCKKEYDEKGDRILVRKLSSYSVDRKWARYQNHRLMNKERNFCFPKFFIRYERERGSIPHITKAHYIVIY